MYTFKEKEKIGFLMPPVVTNREKREIKEFIDKCIAAGNIQVIADASNLILIDSEGVNFMVENVKQLKKLGGGINIRNLTGEASLLFQQTGLDRLFSFQESSTGNEQTPKSEFSLDLNLQSEIQKDMYVMHLSGIICAPKGTQMLREDFQRAAAQFKKIILDLDGMKYMDSPSISEFLILHRSFEGQGGKACFCNANKLMMDIFYRVGLNLIIQGYDTMEQAILALKK